MTKALGIPKLTFWRAVFAILMLAGAYSTFVRFYYGLGAATNLSDEFPWGIWVGFDVLCGVALAAGGFTLAATVHLFNLEKYKPVVRPAILTAFLGYLLVVAALMFDLGRPYRVWHPLIMWNPHSVMFEVGWCVTLYTTVLFLEFVPVIFEKLKWHRARQTMRTIMIPLVIAGVVLSTLHQSSLGTLYLLVPYKLYPLWYTGIMPLLFYISALCVGLAMTIFESWHSSKALNRHLETPLLAGLARVLAVGLAFYQAVRFLDLKSRGVLALLTLPRMETYMFLLETALLVVPMLLLFRLKTRLNPAALYACAVSVLFGFIANRLNVAITGMESASGTHYVPKWTEIAITLSIIAAGFAIFRAAAHYLPIFPAEEGHQKEEEAASAMAVGARCEPSMARGD